MDGVRAGVEVDSGGGAGRVVWVTVGALSVFLATVAALAALTHLNHSKARLVSRINVDIADQTR